jgi:hypothetical protein
MDNDLLYENKDTPFLSTIKRRKLGISDPQSKKLPSMKLFNDTNANYEYYVDYFIEEKKKMEEMLLDSSGVSNFSSMSTLRKRKDSTCSFKKSKTPSFKFVFLFLLIIFFM